MLRADVVEAYDRLWAGMDGLAADAVGGRPAGTSWEEWGRDWAAFSRDLQDPEAKALAAGLEAKLAVAPPAAAAVAEIVGEARGRLQQICALEMIAAQRAGDAMRARKFRVLIDLPRHATAHEGTLALQRLGKRGAQRDQVSELLAREHLMWQSTRVREKTDALRRLEAQGRLTPELLALRKSEVQGLAEFPPRLLELAGVAPAAPPQATRTPGPAPTPASFEAWKEAVEAGLPDLLSPEDVQRRERLVLKLLRLVPMEYKAGVRDGEIVIPIEYREAETFTIQAQQMLDEVLPSWKRTKPQAVAASWGDLRSALAGLEQRIEAKGPQEGVTAAAEEAVRILQDAFGVSLQRQGKASAIVEETALEVRSLLGESLQAAKAGKWSQAESLRLEAYTTFDLEIEARVLPRDPALAQEVERRFLDGASGNPGIKAVLDARNAAGLDAAYAHALRGLDECQALLKVGLSPLTVGFTAFTIMVREGLEAVVILAALLAGFRGPENTATRRRLAAGAWLAIGASFLTFLLGHYLVQSLSRYGERLEAVISLLAVVVLLMVTNWVFHKYYWVQWNARLRTLSRKVDNSASARWEGLAMVGVGFLTIYREGFETTLFMQSLILEGGWRPALGGLAAGLAVIATLGFAIFWLGAKLPYRKLLVITGLLVVSILVTFLGSTVRLFQTVGWLPVHPVGWLDIPPWVGLWLGIYPSWEGIVIPCLGLGYVAGAWLWVKFSANRGGMPQEPAPHGSLPLEPASRKAPSDERLGMQDAPPSGSGY